jgi:hypothetical protein
MLLKSKRNDIEAQIKYGTKTDSISSTNLVRDKSRNTSTNDGSPSQSSSNATLPKSVRVVEVIDVLISHNNSGDRADIETKEHATNGRNKGEEIGVIPDRYLFSTRRW